MRKVNKSSARKHFNNGGEVSLIPAKVNKAGVFQPITISKQNMGGLDFDSLVSDFEYKYCNSELGTYAHYYING